jgi:hypothetical protein
MGWVGLALGALMGAIILADPVMRSWRTAALTGVGSVGGSIAFALAPQWTPGNSGELALTLTVGAIGIASVALPVLASWRLPSTISSLPPADYREHQLVSEIRRLLARDATVERQAQARALLEDTPLVSAEWGQVRVALLAQIDQSEHIRAGNRMVALEELLAARRATTDAWRAAIASRRRFFR